MNAELFNARKFVHLWFHKLKGFKMKSGGNFVGNSKVLQDALLLDYEDLVNTRTKEVDPMTGRFYKVKALTDKILKCALNEFLYEEAKRIRKETVKQLAFTNASDVNLTDWLKALVENPTETHVNVLKHTLWLIKRKANEQSVVHHICPVFFGPQGSGKTWAVNQLLKPITDLKLEWDIPAFTDSRNTPMLEENLVVLLDELAGVKWADLGELKRRITNEYLDFRVLGTHRQIKVKNNCTVIGLSNKAVSDVINDQTGNRRFFQYDCKERTDRVLLNNIDVLSIWQCVDENKERGYYEQSENEIQEVQQSYQLDGEFQTFIKDMQMKDEGPKVWAHVKTVYEAYVSWKPCSGFRDDPSSSVLNLGRALQTAGFSGALKYLNGRQGMAYLVNENSLIFKVNSTLQVVETRAKWNGKEVKL